MRGIQAGFGTTAEGSNQLSGGKHLRTWSRLTHRSRLPITEPILVNLLLKDHWMSSSCPVSVQVSLKRREALLVTVATTAETVVSECSKYLSRWVTHMICTWWAGPLRFTTVCGCLSSQTSWGRFPTVLNFSEDANSTKGHFSVELSCAIFPGCSSVLFSQVLICAFYFHSLASGTADRWMGFSSCYLSIVFKDLQLHQQPHSPPSMSL